MVKSDFFANFKPIKHIQINENLNMFEVGITQISQELPNSGKNGKIFGFYSRRQFLPEWIMVGNMCVTKSWEPYIIYTHT